MDEFMLLMRLNNVVRLEDRWNTKNILITKNSLDITFKNDKGYEEIDCSLILTIVEALIKHKPSRKTMEEALKILARVPLLCDISPAWNKITEYIRGEEVKL